MQIKNSWFFADQLSSKPLWNKKKNTHTHTQENEQSDWLEWVSRLPCRPLLLAVTLSYCIVLKALSGLIHCSVNVIDISWSFVQQRGSNTSGKCINVVRRNGEMSNFTHFYGHSTLPSIYIYNTIIIYTYTHIYIYTHSTLLFKSLGLVRQFFVFYAPQGCNYLIKIL